MFFKYFLCLTTLFLTVKPIIITQPGSYTIKNDIQGNLPIEIKASHVILDLDDQTLINGSDGIVIHPNLTDIQIKNGILQNISGAGITVSAGCSRIMLSNITTVSCQTTAIQLQGTAFAPIADCLLDNVKSFSCSNQSLMPIPAIIQLTYCNNCEIKKCLISDSNNQTLVPMLIENCSGCRFKEIVLQANNAIQQYTGFYIKNSNICSFEKCVVSKNGASSLTSTLFGFWLIGSVNNNIFSNCLVCDNSKANMVAGFMLDNITSGTIGSNLFAGCQSLNNSAMRESYGFSLKSSSKNNNFFDCIAAGSNTLLIPSSAAIGFLLQNSQGCKFNRCVANDQLSLLGVGFDIKTCVNCQFKDSQAQGNIGSTTINSFGFRINNGTTPDAGSNRFVNNLAINNGTTLNNQMNNFIPGSFKNVTYANLDTVAKPLINVGII